MGVKKKCLYCDGDVYAKKLCRFHYYKLLRQKYRSKQFGKPIGFKKIRKVSKSAQSSNYWYKKIRKQFFSREENQLCKARVDGVCNIHATDVHHMAGRIGELLTNPTYFLPVCRQCHRYLHDHAKWAEEHGFIIHL